MNFLNLFRSYQPDKVEEQKPQPQPEERGFNYYNDSLNYNFISSYTTNQHNRLSAVYAATNQISNAIGVMPFNVYETDNEGFKNINFKHYLNDILEQPSSTLTRFNYLKLIGTSIMLNGNAYSKIVRKDNKVIEIQFIHPNDVEILFDKKTKNKQFKIKSENRIYSNKDFLHFYYYTNDGVIGVSVINYAINSLKLASDAENHSSKFFKSGASLNGVLNASGTLTAEQKQQINMAWNAAFNNPDSSGVAVLPQNLEFQPISINPADSQLLESRQYSVIEIARFFNISPIKLFDLTKNSYATLEQTQLSFLSDTVLPYITLIELELNNKIFNEVEKRIYKIKFDESVLLTTDMQSTVEYYSKMVEKGLMTINEARRKLNLNDRTEGDKLVMQMNMSSVENIIKQLPQPKNTRSK
jgi:HK97 family phage portal protein